MIDIVQNLCTKCGLCAKVCPSMIYRLTEGKFDTEYEEYCILCGHCLSVCPQAAIRHEKLEYSQFKDIPDININFQDLLGLFQSRRSIRNFKKQQVSRELIQNLINATIYAPTASNRQNVKFLILQDEKISPFITQIQEFYKKVLDIYQSSSSIDDNDLSRRIRKWKHWFKEAEEGKDAIFFDAPVIIIVYAPSSDSMASLNVGYAVSYLMLAAHVYGLGTVNIGYALEAIRRKQKIAKNLGITDDQTVYAVMSLGYPALKYTRVPLRNPPTILWN